MARFLQERSDFLILFAFAFTDTAIAKLFKSPAFQAGTFLELVLLALHFLILCLLLSRLRSDVGLETLPLVEAIVLGIMAPVRVFFTMAIIFLIAKAVAIIGIMLGYSVLSVMIPSAKIFSHSGALNTLTLIPIGLFMVYWLTIAMDFAFFHGTSVGSAIQGLKYGLVHFKRFFPVLLVVAAVSTPITLMDSWNVHGVGKVPFALIGAFLSMVTVVPLTVYIFQQFAEIKAVRKA